MYAVYAEDQGLYNKRPLGGIQLFIQTVWGKLKKVPFLYEDRIQAGCHIHSYSKTRNNYSIRSQRKLLRRHWHNISRCLLCVSEQRSSPSRCVCMGRGGHCLLPALVQEKRELQSWKKAVLRLELYWYLISFNVFMLLLKDSLAALFAPDCGLQSIGSRLNFTASSWVTWEMSFSFKKCGIKAGLVRSLKRILGWRAGYKKGDEGQGLFCLSCH